MKFRRLKTRRARGGRGYTMVELTVSAAVATVLIGAVGSALLISSYALPARQSVFAQTTSAAPVTELITADLQYAVHVPVRQAQAITVIVPDRDGDGDNERIEYTWSGVAGAPLQRRYNGGTVVSLLPRVADFALRYQTTSVSEEYPGPPVEDTTDSVIYEYTNTTKTTQTPIDTNSYVAQVFTPAAPAMATLWRATEIRVHAEHRPTLAGATLKLFATDDAGKPTGSQLWGTLIWGNNSSPGWTSAGFFPPAAKLPVRDTYCMELEGTFGTVLDLSLNRSASDGLITTSDDGNNWTVEKQGTILCSIRGRYTQPDGIHSISRDHLTRIRIGLQTSGDSATRLETAAWTLNAPELLAAFWTASFWEGNPTTQDHNGDGVVDWQTFNGTSFNAGADINAGTWTPNKDLITNPVNPFNGNTTIELSMRDTDITSGRAHFSINLENDGAQAAPITVFVMLDSDGTQTLEIFNDAAVALKLTGGATHIDNVLPMAMNTLKLLAPLHPLAAIGPMMVAFPPPSSGGGGSRTSGGDTTSNFGSTSGGTTSGGTTSGSMSAAAPTDAVSAAIATPLVHLEDLPPAMIKLRLIANVAEDDLVVYVNDKHYGTYAYRKYTMASPVDRVLVGGNNTAEYEYVRVRVSP